MGYRALHHAPGYLVFDGLPPGTPVRLEGLGAEAIGFAVPPSPVRVRLRRDEGLSEARARVWSVHVDADRAVLFIVHGHAFTYREGDAPAWILVEA
jgi:hypothetical protein